MNIKSASITTSVDNLETFTVGDCVIQKNKLFTKYITAPRCMHSSPLHTHVTPRTIASVHCHYQSCQFSPHTHVGLPTHTAQTHPPRHFSRHILQPTSSCVYIPIHRLLLESTCAGRCGRSTTDCRFKQSGPHYQQFTNLEID